jgi:hypothetical protein
MGRVGLVLVELSCRAVLSCVPGVNFAVTVLLLWRAYFGCVRLV